ncbi:MAG TPA: hypothetical protein VKS43_03395 [Burkholderiales bacterium]|nr:hypothetical protein [Burkholderiales bacterium]
MLPNPSIERNHSDPRVVNAEPPIRFPRLYATIKWAIVITLTLLAILAAAFWTLLLGGFAGSGFHASSPLGRAGESVVITPECAWPYAVTDHDATAVCRMFYNLTPEQRAQVLKARE